jgi:hypothetical protein
VLISPMLHRSERLTSGIFNRLVGYFFADLLHSICVHCLIILLASKQDNTLDVTLDE